MFDWVFYINLYFTWLILARQYSAPTKITWFASRSVCSSAIAELREESLLDDGLPAGSSTARRIHNSRPVYDAVIAYAAKQL